MYEQRLLLPRKPRDVLLVGHLKTANQVLCAAGLPEPPLPNALTQQTRTHTIPLLVKEKVPTFVRILGMDGASRVTCTVRGLGAPCQEVGSGCRRASTAAKLFSSHRRFAKEKAWACVNAHAEAVLREINIQYFQKHA